LALAALACLGFGTPTHAALLPETVVYNGVTYNLSLTNKISMTAANLPGFEADPWWGNEGLALAINRLYDPCNCSVAAYSTNYGVAYTGAITQFDLLTSGPQYWIQDNRYIENPPPLAHNITAKSGNYLNAVGSSLTTEFDGGTLTSTANATTSTAFAITGNGGTLDASGHALVFQGAFSNADAVAAGYLIITDSVGDGRIVLAAANTFTGGIQFEAGATLSISSAAALGAGTLQLLGSTTMPAVLAITGDATIANPILVAGDPVFDIVGGTTTTINSSITDSGTPGDLVKQGGGTLILTATNTYTGPTTIDAGILQIDGSITSPTTVNPGGALAGTGTIYRSLTNDGSVAPGTPALPGILTVSGNYAQGGAGSLLLRITPSAVPGAGYDQLQVGGSASLGGTLRVAVGSGPYTIGQRYDLLHARGSVSGSFSQTAYSGLFGVYVDPRVTYEGNDVYLVLAPQPTLVDSGRMFVASAFALDQALFEAADAALGADELTAGDPGDPRRGVWMHVLGAFGRANGFGYHSGGFVLGRGFHISPVWTVGFAGSSLFSTTAGDFGTVADTETGATGYGIYHRHRLQASFSESVGNLTSSLRRTLSEYGVAGKAGGGGLYDVAATRIQYLLGLGDLFVVPAVEAAYVHTQTGAMTETGAGALGLRYASLSTDIGRLSAGITGGMWLRRSFGSIEPWVSVGAFGSLGNTRAGNVETIGLATSAQTALVAPPAAWTTGLGINVTGRDNWRVDAQWLGTWGSSTSAETFAVDVRYVW
jgi:autotransporter-associated beta strand protein